MVCPDPDGNGKEPGARKVISRMNHSGERGKARATNLAVALVTIVLTGCSSQSRHTMLVPQYNSKPAHCHVEIFTKGHPSQQFERISRLDVHIERTYYVKSQLDDALPEMRKEACASGADAVIDIQERSSNFNLAETNMYHVTGTGVRYIP